MHSTLRLKLLYRAARYRWKVERHEIAFVLQNLRAGQTALDIGAHKGGFTYWMQRAVGPRGRLFAFEPQVELAEYLDQVKRVLHLRQLTVVNAALSRAPGRTYLVRPTWTPSPGARLAADPRGPEAHWTSVSVESLDHFCRQRNVRPVHFIKCDVEGHELEVFQGGEQTLREDRPTLLFECERRHRRDGNVLPVFEYLRQLGYSGYFRLDERWRPVAEFNADVYQNPDSKPYIYNFVFLPGTRQA